MSRIKLAFMAYEKDLQAASLRDELVAAYADDIADPEEADALVPVGGDGNVLHVLRNSGGKKVYAIRPPQSKSAGFLTNEYNPDENLVNLVDESKKLLIVPVQAKMTHEGGVVSKMHGFNDICVERRSPQAAEFNLKGRFIEAAEGVTVMGDGLIFATPLGSTAQNFSSGGGVVHMSMNAIVMTGMAVSRPSNFRSVAFPDDMEFEIHPLDAAHKRPVRVSADGIEYFPVDDAGPIERIDVSLAPDQAAVLARHKGTPVPYARLWDC